MRGDIKRHYQVLGTSRTLHGAKDQRLLETSQPCSHSMELHGFSNNAASYTLTRPK